MKKDKNNYTENQRILYGDKFFAETTEAEKSGEKTFNKIFLGDKFQKAVAEIRKSELNMRENCFTDDKDLEKWYLQNKSSIDKKMSEFLPSFLENQLLPNNDWWRKKIMDYILFNGAKLLFSPLSPTQLPFIEMIDKKSFRKAHTDLCIYPGITQNDITEFVVKNWQFIEPKYTTGPAEKIGRKEKENLQAQIFIANYCLKSKAELKEIFGIEKNDRLNKSKWSIISKRLYIMGYGKFTPANVKTIYYRLKKRRR